MAFEAVVTDLDGTVVRRDGSVSEATLRAARALGERGVPLVAATARTPNGVLALSELAPTLDFAVCCSGALGYVPATRTIAWREPMPRDAVTGLTETLARRLPTAGWAAFDGSEWRMTAAYQAMRPSVHKGPVSVVQALGEMQPCAMVVGHEGWDAVKLMAELAGLTTLGLHRAGSRFVEVTAASVDKASGVLHALRTLGVAPERAIAFGDMPIDTAMFSVVGRSVAMADAPPEVLAAATDRTASVEDDGFARYLDRCG
ncbi:HAD family hydrolase [Actinoplanes sp. Pm04-4]|uniref:HAD family hydrolase n=1 Tax=Paractinoplanes pyxinae TaxID=2997416 RepID=A0ABT4BCI4_9ACTN|nr:HAD family hydrolase [Actinoplanes pyxinae]MCY1144232.1 HAD family hydrolase [Actinoplanes pyxinae]